MSDFSNIIQEINTNLPDNNTQSITAAKLRTTLIDLTNEIDSQQDGFEVDIQNEFENLATQISGAVIDFQAVIVDNLDSTDATKALSAKQGKVLKETIYGTNDTTEGTAFTFPSVTGSGFANGTSASSNCFITSGNIRSVYFNVATFNSLELKKYRYLRITANSSWNSYITFLTKKGRPIAQKTYQELVDEGYLSKVHDSYSKVLITITYNTTQDIEIPNDANAFMIITRSTGDGSSASTTLRQPSSIIPYGLLQPDNIYYNVTVPDGYINSNMIGDGEVKTDDIADGAVTSDKVEDGFIIKEMSDETNEYFSFNLIDFNNLTTGAYINSSGVITTGVTSTYVVTNMIKIDNKKIYWGIGFSGYGSGTNGAAVYKEDGTLVRSFKPASSGSYDPAEQTADMEAGAYWLRFTWAGNHTLRYIVYANSDGTNPMAGSNITTSMIDDYYRDQVINTATINLSFPKENTPELIPAYSSVGQDGCTTSTSTLSANTNFIIPSADYPSYLKTCHTISFKAKLTSLTGTDTIRFGINAGSTSGKALLIGATTASIQRYDGGYVTNVSYSHGLSIADFIMVEVNFGWFGGKMRITSSGGTFVKEWANSEYSYTGNSQVNFGRAFINSTIALTNVKLNQTSDRFRKPVWVCGDSYTSMASARWTYQMINTFGIDNMLILGYAGAGSDNILPDLKKALNYGTPKYLYWCLGMNDNPVIWKYCSTEVECLCRERGITLIYQTIPWPTSGYTNKATINEYIKSSGYRYVDGYDAVCSDDQGTWYTGMLDDGVHTTVLGAKAMAAQVLTDFPEIAAY